MKCACERGNVVIMFALCAFVLAGVSAFALDLPHGYTVQGRLQNAADAGALAAAQSLHESTEKVEAVAIEMVNKNLSAMDDEVTHLDDVTLGRYDGQVFLAGGSPVNAVRVRARRSADRDNAVQTYLASLIGTHSMDVTVEAIAAHVGPSICMFALDPSASQAFRVGGGGSINVPNCGIQVDSTASDAMTASCNSSVLSQINCVAGGWSGNIAPTPEQCELQPDPLNDLPEPTAPNNCFMEDENLETNTILPAVRKYCGKIQINGDTVVTLQDGIYYFGDNATLKLNNNSSLDATNAMLYLDETSNIEMASTGSFTLTPPEAGPYRGIGIFGSRQGTAPASKIGGGYQLKVKGAIYLPGSHLDMAGGSALSVEAGYIIANSYRFTGNSQAHVTMNPGMSPTNLSGRALLVQ